MGEKKISAIGRLGGSFNFESQIFDGANRERRKFLERSDRRTFSYRKLTPADINIRGREAFSRRDP
jgi:hypothetical protein